MDSHIPVSTTLHWKFFTFSLAIYSYINFDAFWVDLFCLGFIFSDQCSSCLFIFTSNFLPNSIVHTFFAIQFWLSALLISKTQPIHIFVFLLFSQNISLLFLCERKNMLQFYIKNCWNDVFVAFLVSGTHTEMRKQYYGKRTKLFKMLKKIFVQSIDVFIFKLCLWVVSVILGENPYRILFSEV